MQTNGDGFGKSDREAQVRLTDEQGVGSFLGAIAPGASGAKFLGARRPPFPPNDGPLSGRSAPSPEP